MKKTTFERVLDYALAGACIAVYLTLCHMAHIDPMIPVVNAVNAVLHIVGL